ncbi:DUF3098 domain-containing protein [Sinomicrobium sp.]
MSKKDKSQREFIFQKKNYTVMFAGLALIALGFILMSGGGTDDPTTFNSEIFSFRRIRLAPTLVIVGFAMQIYAILLSPKAKNNKNE